MTSNAREFVDFWIENSIHAMEQFRTPGASQDVADLANRLLEDAKAQNISKTEMGAEVGDLADYIRGKLKAANRAESDRQRPS